MSDTPIASREAALRIALAARALSDLNVKELVNALADKLGLPITENKLARLTVEDLREILAGDHADQACHVGIPADLLKEAVRLFWGQGVSGSDLPALESYSEGDMPGSIRVAFASNHNEALDGHFGSCERFLVYQVSPTEMRLIEVRSALEADQEEDRNAARAALINDCQIVYIQSIGGPAAAKVIRANVHPVKVPAGGVARDVLAQLQGRLTMPPPWLAQIMGVPASTLAKFETEDESLEEDTL